MSDDLSDVLATTEWKSNAHLIEDVARLGYMHRDWRTLDATYGMGTWWDLWQPRKLVTNDLDKATAAEFHEDITGVTRWRRNSFDVIAFDPPYKLNGTDQGEGVRYGVAVNTPWQHRMGLIHLGMTECARLLRPWGFLLLKCMDQVCSGQVRWQTIEFANHGRDLGLTLVDRLDMLSYRPQPKGRRQVHARRNTSTLLVMQAPL